MAGRREQMARELRARIGTQPPVFMPPPCWADPEGAWVPVQQNVPGTRKATAAELAAAGKAHQAACRELREHVYRHTGPATGCRACLRSCARHGQDMPCHGLPECTPTTYRVEHVDEPAKPTPSRLLDEMDAYGLERQPRDRETPAAEDRRARELERYRSAYADPENHHYF